MPRGTEAGGARNDTKGLRSLEEPGPRSKISTTAADNGDDDADADANANTTQHTP